MASTGKTRSSTPRNKYNKRQPVVSEKDENSGEEKEQEVEDESDNGEEEVRTGGEEEEEFGDLSFITNRQVLHCSICYGKLRLPLFECDYGHVVCSRCSAKPCDTCRPRYGGFFIRSRALEKVIQSVRIRCSHAKYGCQAIVSFLESDYHEERCLYSPCFCPYTQCLFKGSGTELSAHFNYKHQNLVKKFSYDHRFEIVLYTNQAFLSVQGEDGHLFLLLNNSIRCIPNVGNSLSLAYIGDCTGALHFAYELKTSEFETGGFRWSCLQMKGVPASIKKWEGVYPSKSFLLVPQFFSASGKITMDVCIWKTEKLRRP